MMSWKCLNLAGTLAKIQSASSNLREGNRLSGMTPEGRSVTYFMKTLPNVRVYHRLIEYTKFDGKNFVILIFTTLDVFQHADLFLQCQLAIFDQCQLTDSANHQFEFISNVPEKPVMIDGKLMQHILTNLLSNAGKYSPAKSRITLRLALNDNISIEVSDEGIGIPKKDLEHLFEPFHRAANVGETKGTGLGLSIVKEYVGLHGGSIEVESEVGKGSTFRIQLPAS